MRRLLAKETLRAQVAHTAVLETSRMRTGVRKELPQQNRPGTSASRNIASTYVEAMFLEATFHRSDLLGGDVEAPHTLGSLMWFYL